MVRRNVVVSFLSLLLLLSFLVGGANAIEFKGGESFVLAEGEVISDDVIAGGGEVVIDGTIDGDLIAAGSVIRINGEVTGDVIIAGSEIYIAGEVGDDAILACGVSDVSGPVGDNFLAVSSSFTLGDDASVGRDAVITGDVLDVSGDVERNLMVYGSDIVIGGDVGGDAFLEADSIRLDSGARVNGNLNYTSDSDAVIDEGAVVDGEIIKNEPVSGDAEDGFDIYGFLMMFVTGAFIVLLFPELVKRTALELKNKPVVSGIVGLVAIFGAVVLFFVFMVSVVGLPLGFMGAGLYLMALYVSRAFAGVFVGRLILKQFSTNGSLFVDLLLGLAVIEVLGLVPVVSGLVSVFVYVFGSGALLLALRGTWLEARKKKIV